MNHMTIQDKLASILQEGVIVDDRACLGETVEGLDKIKYYLKRFPLFYSFLINVISPVFPSTIIRSRKFLANATSEIIVNFGSGNSRLSEHIINLDLMDYDNVDFVTDISNTPIKDCSVDKIISIAVLEHVRDPRTVIEEMHRVLKKKGEIYCFIPFIQGFHASPDDYTRVTYEGIKELFKGFEVADIRPSGGPTSGMLWVLQEWLAILLSFGSRTLHRYLYIMIMLITFPVKFLDLLLIWHPSAKNISSGFSITVKKLND